MSELLSLLPVGEKPVVGTVQLGALPGGSRYKSARIGDIVEPALPEASAFAQDGEELAGVNLVRIQCRGIRSYHFPITENTRSKR